MKSLKEQLIDAMRGKCAFGEYLIDAENNDYLLVHCDYNEKYDGLHITADFEKPTHFSGSVIELDNGFVVPFESDYFDNLDHAEQCLFYLEQIKQQIKDSDNNSNLL